MTLQNILETELSRNGLDILGEVDYFSKKFQRFRRRSQPGKGRDIFVIIIGQGDGAAFGDWHDDKAHWSLVWVRSYKELTPKERVERQVIIKNFNTEQLKSRNVAIKRAGLMITSVHCKSPSDTQGYVKLKKIKAVYAGQIRSRLVIPIYGIDGHLQSLQFISKTGKKRFKRGTSPLNGYLCLGEKIFPWDVIRICEGYATGCSIYEAIGSPVIIAFSADNLKNVCRLIRSKYKHNKIIICADNDQWNKVNAGLNAAKFCAENYGALICYPDFSGMDVKNCPTDFNDLMILSGLTVTEDQLQKGI